jgi:hypothetical protein
MLEIIVTNMMYAEGNERKHKKCKSRQLHLPSKVTGI